LETSRTAAAAAAVARKKAAPGSVPARHRLPLKFIGSYLDGLLDHLTDQIVSGEAERRAAALKRQVRETCRHRG
jgi:hypothetical protein